MKRIFLGLAMWSAAVGAPAKWEAFSERELISSSDIIVVAEFKSLSETQEQRYKTQRATFRVKECLKGNVKESVVVSGSTRRIDAPLVAFTGEEEGDYLLFLLKGEAICRHANGSFSVLKIHEGQVSWYASDDKDLKRWERKPTPLKDVRARIAAAQTVSEL